MDLTGLQAHVYCGGDGFNSLGAALSVSLGAAVARDDHEELPAPVVAHGDARRVDAESRGPERVFVEYAQLVAHPKRTANAIAA